MLFNNYLINIHEFLCDITTTTYVCPNNVSPQEMKLLSWFISFFHIVTSAEEVSKVSVTAARDLFSISPVRSNSEYAIDIAAAMSGL